MRFERGADSISVIPAGNQVEHAGRSQVNVIRSSNSGIETYCGRRRLGSERLLTFPLLRKLHEGPQPPVSVVQLRRLVVLSGDVVRVQSIAVHVLDLDACEPRIRQHLLGLFLTPDRPETRAVER